MKKSNCFHKHITLFKQIDYLYSIFYSHSKILKQSNLKSSSSKFIINSSFGVIQIESSGQQLIYSGYLIASNLFLSVLKSINEEEIQKELLNFQRNYVYFSKEKYIEIKKGVRINNFLVILILKENIGDEIGFIGISNNSYNTTKILISYNEDDKNLYINQNLKTNFIFSYINGEYYLTQIGNNGLTVQELKQINNIYKKNLLSYTLMGIPSFNKNKGKNNRLKNFNFPTFTFINKIKSIEDLKSISHFSNLSQLNFIISERDYSLHSLFEKIFYIENKPIQYIDISGGLIGVHGMELISKVSFKNLEYLKIRENNIGNDGIKFLSLMSLVKLINLDISSNQIGPEGMEYLSHMSIGNLEYLDIHRNQIGSEGMEYLSHMSIGNLEYLDIHNNQIGPEGMESLCKLQLNNLIYLNISYNQIGDKGVELLSSMSLANLEYLYMKYNKIGPDGITFLSNTPLARLKYLDVDIRYLLNDMTILNKLYRNEA